jgi:hypothetical protein
MICAQVDPENVYDEANELNNTACGEVEVIQIGPVADAGGPYSGNEREFISFDGSNSSDPDGDPLQYRWDFDDDGIWDTDWSSSPLGQHNWGDDYGGQVVLEVSDGSDTDVDTASITVHNVDPSVGPISYFLNTSFAFRIAGEKWHNVEVHLFEDGDEIGFADIIRYPGSPNEQMAVLASVSVNLSRHYSAIAYYTPMDDPVNGEVWGADPAWFILHSGGGESRAHHTFNVRHEETWIWDIQNVSLLFLGHNITFIAMAADPGSDDITFSWDWGNGNVTVNTCYNDGIGPDPYPSPEVNPITATDTAKHAYASAGTYAITLTVRDDDGGVVVSLLSLAIESG